MPPDAEKKRTNRNPAKRLAILNAAEKTFAKQGFHEATVAQIAQRARVSEATIYEYFAGKEDLLFSIPAETIRQYKDKNRELLENVQGATNKLRLLVFRHLSLYASNGDYAKVVMLALKHNRNFLKTEAYKIVQESARLTTRVIEEGIAGGEFRRGLKPHLVRAILWGTIEHLTIRKSLLNNPKDLMSFAETLINTLLHGILVPPVKELLDVRVLVEDKKADRAETNLSA